MFPWPSCPLFCTHISLSWFQALMTTWIVGVKDYILGQLGPGWGLGSDCWFGHTAHTAPWWAICILQYHLEPGGRTKLFLGLSPRVINPWHIFTHHDVFMQLFTLPQKLCKKSLFHSSRLRPHSCLFHHFYIFASPTWELPSWLS